MTTNQLKFAELRETKQHNREMERQGAQKLFQDYTIGSRQAGAAETQAFASTKQAEAAGIQAATRQQELEQRKLEYSDSGRGYVEAQTDNQSAQAKYNTNKAETERVESVNRQSVLDAEVGKDIAQSFAHYMSGTKNIVDFGADVAQLFITLGTLK